MEASAERPAPSAIGTLATRPLVHLLVYARNRRLSGLLELHAPDGRSGTMSLWRGRIHDTRTVPPNTYFGAVAYELGHIDTATLDSTLLEIAKTKRLHGEVLVERGAITPAQRDAILTEQMCRKFHQLFLLPPESTFAFYESKPTEVEPSFTLDPIRPAWLGLRASPPVESVNEVLSRFAHATLRMANEGPIARAGFDAEEAALCEALTWKPMNLAQLRVTSRLPARRVDLLVYLLIVTKCVEPAASSSSVPATRASQPAMPIAPPSSRPSLPVAPASSRPSLPGSNPAMPAVRASHPSMPAMPRTVLQPTGAPPPRDIRTMSTPAMPATVPGAKSSDSGERHVSLSFRVPSAPAIRSSSSGSSPAIPAQAAPVFSPAELGAVGIAHRASVIASEDPFTVLGLSEGASAEAARAAYFRLAKLWHPDRLARDLAPFRVEVETIFEHMTRAHKTLTDPDARRSYLASASAPATGAKRARNDVLREIEQALAKRDFQTAEVAGRELAAADPDDAEAQALVAWASTFAGEASEETLRAAIPALDRAVNRDRYCERAQYYRGMLHKRLGNNAAAFRDFARVVQINPKHVDAQREVRIFEMRARKGSGEHALDALIAKTKKK